MNADFWSMVGAIATVVAAVAALVTIGFAWATVCVARATRRETSDAHQKEMRERERALATEIKLQQIVQLERVADVLMDLGDTVRREMINPPGRSRIEPNNRERKSGIPVVRARLRTAVALLDALGGPDLPVTRRLRQVSEVPSEGTLNDVDDALREIEELVLDDERFMLERPH